MKKSLISFFLAGLFLCYEFTLQTLPSVIGDPVQIGFGLNSAMLGLVFSVYYYSYAPVQVIAGVSFDQLGSRRTIAFAIQVCVFGTLFICFAQSPLMIAIGRLLTGCGSAFAFIGMLYVGKTWFDSRHFYIVTGLTELLGCIGAVLGQGPVAILVENFGWRGTLFLLAVIGQVLVLLCLLFIFEKEQEKNKFPKRKKRFLLRRYLQNPFQSKQCWHIGVYSFLIFAPITAFAALWGVRFLQVNYHMTLTSASFACSLIWIGMGVGSPIVAWLSEIYKSRTKPLIITAFFGVLCSAGILYMQLPHYWLLLALLMMGVSTAGQSLSFNLIEDSVNKRRIGAAMGINNFMVVISGSVTQTFVGMLLHYSKDSAWVQQHVAPEQFSFMLALSIVPMFYFLAGVVCIFFIKETHPLSQRVILAKQA